MYILGYCTTGYQTSQNPSIVLRCLVTQCPMTVDCLFTRKLSFRTTKSKLTFDILSAIATSLLDGTVFDIVRGLEDIQQLTERNLLNKRMKLVNSHKGNLFLFFSIWATFIYYRIQGQHDFWEITLTWEGGWEVKTFWGNTTWGFVKKQRTIETKVPPSQATTKTTTTTIYFLCS